jgi:hypothetical protein
VQEFKRLRIRSAAAVRPADTLASGQGVWMSGFAHIARIPHVTRLMSQPVSLLC